MILKLRFTTETSQEATFEDLVNFVFETPATALTDAPWTGQVCSEQHVLQYSQPAISFICKRFSGNRLSHICFLLHCMGSVFYFFSTSHMQLLDINEANSCVANWSLVLSQLPLLYQLCSDTHLRQAAEFILQALLLAVREKEDEPQEGTTCVGVAVSVLESEGFASMRRLQELVLDSIFVHAASSIPKWLGS